jgi:hypothetical protein
LVELAQDTVIWRDFFKDCDEASGVVTSGTEEAVAAAQGTALIYYDIMSEVGGIAGTQVWP